MESSIDKYVTSIYPNSIKSSALPKIPLTRGSSRKRLFQEDDYTDFDENETISTLKYIHKSDCTTRYDYKRYDDHIVLRRQITNKLNMPKVSECIRIIMSYM